MTPTNAVSSSSSRIRFSHGEGGAFYRAVRKDVQEYFLRTGKSHFADAMIWVKATVYLAITLGTYILILYGHFGPWTLLALANVYGVATLLLAINAEPVSNSVCQA